VKISNPTFLYRARKRNQTFKLTVVLPECSCSPHISPGIVCAAYPSLGEVKGKDVPVFI
jgi:hypothetical protein